MKKRVSFGTRVTWCVLLVGMMAAWQGCGTKREAVAEAAPAAVEEDAMDHPTIDQIIWYQAVDHQPTKIFLHAADLGKYMGRARDWLEMNDLKLVLDEQTKLESDGGQKGSWDYSYLVNAMPFGEGYVLRVYCRPGVRELNKNAEFNAKRLTHFIKTGEKEKQVGPKVKMTILQY